MPLVDMRDMLQHAHANHYAVGAFDLVSLDFLEGILRGAEVTQAPVILSLAESHFDYFDFELAMPAVVAAAKRARVPVAIHLDHGENLASAVRGIRLGCTGVMIDNSNRPLEENICTTREVVQMAHGCGIPVEGELGYVPGVEGEDAERHPGDVVYTRVEDARRYRDETGIDFLAVSVGTVHGRMKGEPRLDFERLAEINRALQMPLVIHGGTGLGDAQFRTLIEHGVTKINYYTALSDTAGARIRANAASARNNSYTDLVRGVREAIAEETARCIELWGGAGRAADLLEVCRPWSPVEHLILYNAEGLDDAGVADMAAEGRRVLGAIPGVLRAETGSAVKEDADYRHCWLVRFTDAAVIDSYREHPDHKHFADTRFRPVAGGRISIDYRIDRD